MSPLLNPRLWIIGLGIVILPLDSSVNVAFPFIAQAFDLPASALRLVVVTYILSAMTLLLIAGRMGDIWGYRRIFRLGLAISVAALLLNAAAPSYEFLLAARIGQGIGVALTLSCAPALVIGLFPETDRGKAIGAYAMIFAGSMALGPIIGGWVIETWDWRAVFWYRAPLAAAALIGSVFIAERPAEKSRKFDVAGAILLGSAMALIFTSLNSIAASGATAAIAGAAGAGTFIYFIRHQLKSDAPLIDLGYFAS